MSQFLTMFTTVRPTLEWPSLLTGEYACNLTGHTTIVLFLTRYSSLGATTGPELNILLRRAMDWLHQRDITVERCCAGHFLTSLDMASTQNKG